MPRLDLVAGGAGGVPQEAFEIAFADAAAELRLPLTEALSVPFEACRPVRDFPSYKGQRHYSPSSAARTNAPSASATPDGPGRTGSRSSTSRSRPTDATPKILAHPMAAADYAVAETANQVRPTRRTFVRT